MQRSFSRLWDGYASDKEALLARNREAKMLKQAGARVRCFTLPNQIKKYDGLGQPNGGVCNVYFIDYGPLES